LEIALRFGGDLKLVVNADDFGRSAEINRAVERAHRQGVLNSASLMIAGDAAEEAVELARRNPRLSVGLHLVLVDGPTILCGMAANRPVRLGLSYAFSREARRIVATEIEAQFARFERTGLPIAHVDGHQHMHMHPVVFDAILPLAERIGVRRVRIVRDDLRLALRHDCRRAVAKTASALIFAALAQRCERQIVGTCLSSCRRTYGFFQSGMMHEEYVLSVLGQVDGPSEIYFHPTEGLRLDALGPNPIDLHALLSPRVRAATERISAPATEFPPITDAASWTNA
jgi:hopanoid biosynthesis associated protein HpnK